MVLLIVDDQKEVAEGIAHSIEWKDYGFEKVLCAFNAIEAKQIFMRYTIDIMLSDIEMPYESGLELLDWVKSQNLTTKCIMLTSHAEFAYAQKALKLGSDDYILQPAAYEDICAAVVRVAEKLRFSVIQDKLVSIGKSVADSEKKVSEALFYAILEGKGENLELLDSLEQFPDEKQPFWLLMFHVTKWCGEQWEENQLYWVLDNVCGELFLPYHQKYLITSSRLSCCCVIIWSDEELISDMFLMNQLNFFISLNEKCTLFEFAVYIKKGAKRKEIAGLWHQLHEMKEENVALAKGIFRERKHQGEDFRLVYKNRWIGQIQKGYGETTRYEIQKYIDDMRSRGTMTKNNLKRFYSEFLEMANMVAGKEFDLLEKLLVTPADFDLYYNGYESIESIKKLVNRMMDLLAEKEGNEEKEEDVVQKAQQYIQNHIAEEIHRDEIARHIHMNADYLSKLFKKELGVSLKTYVLQQKMKYAQALLKTTNLPIGIIASMIGYDNFSHFSQTYKKITGERPMDAREGKEQDGQ